MTGQLSFEDEINEINLRSVHRNSVAVYENKIKPTIKGRKLEVIMALKQLGGSGDMFQVAQIMNKPIHTVSGRFSELRGMKLIEDTKTNNIHHNNPFTIWALK